MKTKIAATLSLSGIALLIGIFFLFSGIKGVVHVSRISKDYETTEGYFCDYEIYSKGGYDSVKKGIQTIPTN